MIMVSLMAVDAEEELMRYAMHQSKAQWTHSCIAALQERLGVPQKQPVIWIHHVGLPLCHSRSLCLLFFLLLLLLLIII